MPPLKWLMLILLLAVLAGGVAYGVMMMSAEVGTLRPVPLLVVEEKTVEDSHHAPNDHLQGQSADTILKTRTHLDQSVFAKEVTAQEYEQTFIALWDAMRARVDDQHELLARFPFDTLTIRSFSTPQAHRWSIETAAMAGESRILDSSAWKTLIQGYVAQGYRLVHSEWHHPAMTIDAKGVARSTVAMKLFIDNSGLQKHLVISGKLAVTWSGRKDEQGLHVVSTIDATGLSLTAHTGPDAFVEVERQNSQAWPNQNEYINMSPVLVYDLQRTGHPDLIIPSLNVIYRNHSTHGHITFSKERLFPRDHVMITTGVIADFNGDGWPDLLVAGKGMAPIICYGKANGTFADGVPCCPGVSRDSFQLPMCITAGDVDGDGKVDFFIAQYRFPYNDGNIPNPYYDANDGFPSYLFLNNGDGTFRDATLSSGLSPKRHRRTYSAALVDLTGSGHLDLMTVNDFSGVDAYRNDGHGVFTDISSQLFDQRSSFGMSSAIADFDGDGKLDVFIAGMGSTTARRLDQLKLTRADYPDLDAMRMPMAFGNRIYLGGSDHHFQQAAFADQIARTGWSWGSAACDFGNDGLPDLYITNGHMSRSTAKDYCTRFWTQDIYMGNGGNDAFAEVFSREDQRLGNISWNGFEHKALLMNEGGRSFLDVAFPMSLGFEWDGREVIGVDLDGDGMEDLVITQSIAKAFQRTGQEILHIEQNRLPNVHHWLTVRLQDEPGCSPLGATITVTCSDRTFTSCIICGESYRSQHPTSAHFGLGERTQVTAVDIHWIDGHSAHVDHPTIDSDLLVHPH
jgi:hypothetical protein